MRFSAVLPLIVFVLLLAACSDDESTLDPTLNDTPIVFTGMELSDFIVDTDTISVGVGQDKSPDDPVTIPLRVSVSVQRPDGSNDAVALRCTVTQDGAYEPVAERSLGQVTSGTHEFAFDLNLNRGDVGDYRVEVSGVDASGATAASAFAKLRVIYGSNPHVLVDLRAPDSVRVPAQTTTMDLSVLVEDKSGLGDIKTVFFNSFLPDGRPSTGNPFVMRDQGVASNGDEVAGDGWYSIRVSIPSTATKGEYEFQFRAVDYSNATSNVIIHNIILY